MHLSNPRLPLFSALRLPTSLLFRSVRFFTTVSGRRPSDLRLAFQFKRKRPFLSFSSDCPSAGVRFFFSARSSGFLFSQINSFEWLSCFESAVFMQKPNFAPGPLFLAEGPPQRRLDVFLTPRLPFSLWACDSFSGDAVAGGGP